MAVQTAAVRSSDLKRLQSALRGWDARLRLQQSVNWLPKGLLTGAILAFAVALAARLWPLMPRQDVIALAILLTALGALGALVGVWLWKRTPFQLARRFDVLFGLKERLSTALELGHGILPAESQVLARQQLEQALRVAGHVDPARFIPLRPGRRALIWWGSILAALLASGLAIFIPNPQEQVLAQQAEVDQAVTQTLEELEHLREQAIADPSLTPEQQQAVVQALDEAIKTLEQPGVSQEEALAALDAAQQDLRDLSEQYAAEQQAALQQASGLFNGTAAQEVAEALAQGDFQGAGQALQNIDPSTLTPEQQQQLAQALQAAADAVQGTDPQTAQALENAAQALENAAQASQSGDAAAAGQALDQAGQALDQAGQAMAQAGGQSTSQVDQYADQVGEGQSAVARAGKTPGTQPGQGGMGQAPSYQPGAPGAEQQDGVAGLPGGGAGRGEGGGDAGPGGQSGQMPTDNGPGDGGERDYEDVFAPQRVGGEGGEDVDIPGNPDAGVPTGAEGDFATNPSGESNVPYNEVWTDYASAVNQALESGYIPLGLRDLVKNYFGSLDPNGN